LPLLEEAIAAKSEALSQARTVLADRVVVIAQMKTKVERVVRRDAHSAGTCRKRMAKAVPIQKGRMERTHIVLCSMA
jgi:dephospho-CoA kinase